MDPCCRSALEERDHRLRQRVVIRVPATSDPLDAAGLGDLLGVADRQILRAAIAVMDEVVQIAFLARPDRLLERVVIDAPISGRFPAAALRAESARTPTRFLIKPRAAPFARVWERCGCL
jgi:hypothetical protein